MDWQVRTVFMVLSLTLGLASCCPRDPPPGVWFGARVPPPEPPRGYTLAAQLVALQQANPAADARRAYGDGDQRLAAFAGIGLSTPGLQGRSVQVPRLGVKIILGTGDSISAEIDEALNSAATEYAIKYNAEILMLLTTRGKGVSTDQEIND